MYVTHIQYCLCVCCSGLWSEGKFVVVYPDEGSVKAPTDVDVDTGTD